MKNNECNLYELFLTYSYDDLMELFKNAKSRYEQDFYVVLSDLVLQRKARKVIGIDNE